MSQFTILLVEDDCSLAEVTLLNLKKLGVCITHCSDGQQAWNLLQTKTFDLVILDIMLPGKAGTDICRDLRSMKPKQHIMMLTSMTSELDVVLGLELGADDYLTKPYRIRELLARVKAQLRQVENQQQSEHHSQFTIGDLSIDTACHTVTFNGKPIKLTAKEFDLLVYLGSHPGKVFAREQLLEKIWGYHFDGYDHTVNTHINRLRNKLKPLDYVQTIWGVGYCFKVA